MELIGGVLVDGVLRRDVELAPLTGEVELALADLADADLAQPERVTRFLARALVTVGGAEARPEALSVGDRQHLVRAIGAALGPDRVWLTSRCTACGSGFDFPVRQSELPFKTAGPGYPQREIVLRGRKASLRAPTGHDQAAVAHLDEAAGLLALIDRLLEGEEAPAARELDAAEIAAIDDAIEEMMPEVATEAVATCPECAAENRVAVDPYLTFAAADGDVYQEIHALACNYTWSEPDILRLPKARRKRYAAMISRERGVISAPGRAEW